MKEYVKVLQEIKKEQAEYGEKTQPPASAEEINFLKEQAKKVFNAEIPKEYIEFLEHTNGLIWQNLTIYATHRSTIPENPEIHVEGFIEANLIAREVEDFKDLLVFGHSGNVDLFVRRISTAEYQILDYISLSETENLPDFDSLLLSALQTI